MAATATYDLKIVAKQNEHQLLAAMYEAATAIGNDQLSSLAACIVRIANSLKNELRKDRVAYDAPNANVPPGPYVAPDDAAIDAWIADAENDLHEQFDDLNSELMPSTRSARSTETPQACRHSAYACGAPNS